jgi:hypothetical protein
MSALLDHILSRLASTGVRDETAMLVLGAADGYAALANYLAGTGALAKPTLAAATPAGPAVEPSGAFVGAITVLRFPRRRDRRHPALGTLPCQVSHGFLDSGTGETRGR